MFKFKVTFAWHSNQAKETGTIGKWINKGVNFQWQKYKSQQMVGVYHQRHLLLLHRNNGAEYDPNLLWGKMSKRWSVM